MTDGRFSGHFLANGRGAIFVLLREPVAASRTCVIVIPPFAEEMNKCRRMVTLVAKGLTLNGTAVIVPDLYGTGDSSGDFSETGWDIWQHDLGACAEWAGQRGFQPTGLLAIRLGAALAVSALQSGALPAVRRSILWQPVFDGERFLSQFLRLRMAATLMSQDRKETMSELRTQLQSGMTVDVAGYPLTCGLTSGLDATKVPETLALELGDIRWLEIVRESGAELPVPSQRLLDKSQAAGRLVQAETIVGEPFWSSTEIVVNRQLVEHTIAAFKESQVSTSPVMPREGCDEGSMVKQ